MSENVRNRWIVVIGAILIQLALGSLYSWGTMTVFVSAHLKMAPEITVYIFGVSIVAFAITMIQAGKLQQKFGPKKVAMLGGIIIGIGVFLSAAMAAVGSFIGLLITYGFIFGAGIGIAYVCPIACANKWFPDKKGFITGIAVAGFGAGSFIFNYLVKFFAAFGVPVMYILLGIVYLVFVLGGALTLDNPPEGWLPAGWTPPPPVADSVNTGLLFEREEIVKLPQTWMLVAAFMLSAMCGLIVIGSFAAFARSNSSYAISSVDFVLVGSLAALFNGAGRIVWGKIADTINFKNTMIIMFLVQAVLCMIYFTTNSNQVYFLLITCLIFFCFGGNLSLFPTATSDLYGAKNMGQNYGVVFLGYGIAGFVGAIGVNLFVTAFGSYAVLFIFMGCMSVGAAVIIFFLKPPTK